jgi:hypothetical protein
MIFGDTNSSLMSTDGCPHVGWIDQYIFGLSDAGGLLYCIDSVVAGVLVEILLALVSSDRLTGLSG